MGEQDVARLRLMQALEKIEARLKLAEARPSREEIEGLKARRESDLIEIQELRQKIEQMIEELN